MPSCQCEPVQHAVRRVASQTGHRPQAATLAQERQRFDYRRARASQGLEERMLIGAEGVPARRAVVASLHVAKDLDVAGSRDPVVGARLAVAPSPSGFHDASPPGNDDTSDGLSGPTAYWYIGSGFTAYGYSTYVRVSASSSFWRIWWEFADYMSVRIRPGTAGFRAESGSERGILARPLGRLSANRDVGSMSGPSSRGSPRKPSDRSAL